MAAASERSFALADASSYSRTCTTVRRHRTLSCQPGLAHRRLYTDRRKGCQELPSGGRQVAPRLCKRFLRGKLFVS